MKIETPALPDSDNKTLQDLIALAADSDGTLRIIEPEAEAQLLTYAELAGRARRMSGALAKRVPPGSVVLIAIPEIELYWTVIWACQWAGLIAAPMSTPIRFVPEECYSERLLSTHKRLGAAVLMGPSVAQHCRALFEGVHRSALLIDASELTGSKEAPAVEVSPQDTAILMHTSGTSGPPNLVRLSHANFLASIRGYSAAAALDESDVHLNWLPATHISALTRGLTACYWGGHQVQIVGRLIATNPLRWLEEIERWSATNSWAPNFAYARLLDALEKAPHDIDLTKVRLMIAAGEPAVPSVVQRVQNKLQALGMPPEAFRASYGMTELCSSVTISSGPLEVSAESPFVTAGEAIAGTEIRVVDDSGALVGSGETGFVEVRGPTVTPGYLSGSSPRSEEGWLHTGDIGLIQEGALTIVDRAKDVIIVNGVNYYCGEIEQCALSIGGLSHAVAVGYVEPGSASARLALFVVCQADLPRKIRAAIGRNVGIAVSKLQRIEATEIPRTPGGKVMRRKLRERLGRG